MPSVIANLGIDRLPETDRYDLFVEMLDRLAAADDTLWTERQREDLRRKIATLGVTAPVWAAQVENALDRLAAYKPNWDGYGAPAIRQEVIEAARTFARALPADLPRPPRVVPMSPGNLQFEWHDGPKVLELEFEDPNTVRFLQWDPAVGLEEEGTFPATDTESAVGLIRWFTNGVVSV
jgi:hypothetical protein